MKGLIAEGTGLVDFVFKIITQRHHTEEEIRKAITKAEDEMVKNGIVAVGDICNNDLTLDQKQEHRLHYFNFIESSGWLPALSDTRFSRALQLFKEFSKKLIINNAHSIVPHAPYSVSEDLWVHIQPYFEKRVVSIHNQETIFEDQFFREGKGDFIRMYELMKISNEHHNPTGLSSLQSYYKKLSGALRIILVHNTFTSQEDIDFINHNFPEERYKTFFCLCPNANLYIENILPPIQMFRDNKCSIVLGTDSLASNRSLNITDEIKTIRKQFPAIPLEETLRWATSNGARALGMEEQLGSFEKGRKPGVFLLNIEETNYQVKKIM
jgi:cytosine/adenosine deaminase-related metal-dependent hydrolase